MNDLRKISDVIEDLGRVQRDRYYGPEGNDALTDLLGNAYILLRQADMDARHAIAAIGDALRDVPWVDHPGDGDPDRSYPEYVQVRFRDGDTDCGIRWDWDQNWAWKDPSEHDGDIVAYRALPTSSPSKQ